MTDEEEIKINVEEDEEEEREEEKMNEDEVARRIKEELERYRMEESKEENKEKESNIENNEEEAVEEEEKEEHYEEEEEEEEEEEKKEEPMHDMPCSLKAKMLVEKTMGRSSHDSSHGREEGRKEEKGEGREMEEDEEEEERRELPWVKEKKERYLSTAEIRAIIRETVNETIRRYLEPYRGDIESIEELKERVKNIERSLSTIPSIERRITEEIKRTARRASLASGSGHVPVTVPEYRFYYDPWAVMKGYLKYGIYVSVDMETNIALEQLIRNYPRHYFWYMVYLGPSNTLKEQEIINAINTFGGDKVTIGNEVFVIDMEQPASPMQQKQLLHLNDLYDLLRGMVINHEFAPDAERFVREVIKTLEDGHARLSRMTQSELRDLSRQLAESWESRLLRGKR